MEVSGGNLLGESRAGGWIANCPPTHGPPELPAPRGRGEGVLPGELWEEASKGVEHGMLRSGLKKADAGVGVRSGWDGVGGEPAGLTSPEEVQPFPRDQGPDGKEQNRAGVALRPSLRPALPCTPGCTGAPSSLSDSRGPGRASQGLPMPLSGPVVCARDPNTAVQKNPEGHTSKCTGGRE